MLGKGVISHVVSLHGSNLDGEFHKSQGKVVSVGKFVRVLTACNTGPSQSSVAPH